MEHKREFLFEDFTLILSRNCNLQCRYCPLKHFPGEMSFVYVESLFNKLMSYKGYKLYVTLFGGEPLINKKVIFFVYEYLKQNESLIRQNNLFFELKLITNGTLLDDSYRELFLKFHKLEYVDFLVSISIDGSKDTQLSQRNYKNAKIDYYDVLQKNIELLIQSGVSVQFGLVMDFFNENVLNDITFLLETFPLDVFIMPVDLKYEFILNNKKDILNLTEAYIYRLKATIEKLQEHKLQSRISNFKVKDRIHDIKLPPIGPTIDYNGDIYVTRDFLFTLDDESLFSPLGHIDSVDFSSLVAYFDTNCMSLQQDALKKYFGRSYKFNKTIGDYFTKLVFSR